jgi:hypothetical protein
MSKMEILAELPKLELADRREIFDRICEMEEHDLLTGGATDEEKPCLTANWKNTVVIPKPVRPGMKLKPASANHRVIVFRILHAKRKHQHEL